MNSNLTLCRTRFTCRIVRRWCALTEAAAPQHAARCVACQEYFAAVASLEEALRRDALRSTPLPSIGFEQRILSTVRTSGRELEVAAPRRTAWLPAWTGFAALVAVALVLAWSNRPPRPPVDLRSTAADAALVVDTVENLSSQLVDSVIPTTAQFVARNPLQQEASSLYADARSAIGFLAMNFLPKGKDNAPPRSG